MPRPSMRRYFRHGLLPQLMVFEAVSRLGNVTRAAEELHLAQPTVSTQMKKLSATLGMALLEQRGRRLHLTAAGELLAATSRELVEVFARLEARLVLLRAKQPGPLRIGTVPGGRHIAARLLATFCMRHPGVQAGLYVGDFEDIIARLSSGEDEFCVMLTSRQSERIEMHPVATELLRVYASTRHRLAETRDIPAETLALESLVLREPGSAMRATMVHACALKEAELQVRAELASNEAIAEAIARGLGIGLLPENEAQPFVQTGSVAALDVRGFPLQRHFGLARIRGKDSSVLGELFLREALEAQKPEIDAEMPRVRVAAK